MSSHRASLLRSLSIHRASPTSRSRSVFGQQNRFSGNLPSRYIVAPIAHGGPLRGLSAWAPVGAFLLTPYWMNRITNEQPCNRQNPKAAFAIDISAGMLEPRADRCRYEVAVVCRLDDLQTLDA